MRLVPLEQLRPGDRIGRDVYARPDALPLLKAGVRVSESFRHSLERMLRLRGRVVPAYFDAIVGARACVAWPASCDLSKGIENDARSGGSKRKSAPT